MLVVLQDVDGRFAIKHPVNPVPVPTGPTAFRRTCPETLPRQTHPRFLTTTYFGGAQK